MNKNKNKFYTKETEINGVKYVAQFSGISAAIRANDESRVDGNSSNVSMLKLSKYIFENVIVEPSGLTADDFDSLEEFNEVVSFGIKVMQGRFRDEDKDATKTGSKK